MSFASDIAKFANKTGQNMQQVKRVVFFQLAESIVQLTPVDTGRAKGNWQPSKGEFKSGTIASEFPGSVVGSASDSAGRSVMDGVKAITSDTKGDETLCLVNNLPYIKRLEDGYSQKQSPSGMVGLTVQRFNTALKSAVAGL